MAALVIIVGLAVAIGGVVWLRKDQSVSPPEAAPATLAPRPDAPGGEDSNTGLRNEFRVYPRAAVLGDTTALGYVGDLGRGWVEELAKQMCWSISAKSAELETGYTNPGGKPNTSAFTERADDVAIGQPEIVIVEGGLHDYRATPDQLQRAASSVFTTLKNQLPADTMIVAVGPIAGDVVTPEEVAMVSGPIAAAAEDSGVIFIDPMAERWLPDASFYSNDGFLPNGKGQLEYATRFAADLRGRGAPAGC
ncbi:SGNH/GDSL hydrolase family protein [Mycolicibacterium sp. XJ1819]